MTVKWTKVEGSQTEKPAQLDITSSSVYVYMRRNIAQITRTDEEGVKRKFWQYEEAKLTPAEYEAYVDEINSPTYQAIQSQQEEMDLANAEIMLQQAEIQATQSDQDEVLAEILLNTAREV